MLQSILAGYPDILAPSEPWLMLHPLYALKRNGIHAEYEATLARQALDGFLEHLEHGKDDYIAAVRTMAAQLYGNALKQAKRHYLLDKTPRYFHIIAELHQVFPQAKYIFLLRNPLAVLSSVLSTWFGNDPRALAASTNYMDIMQGPRLLADGIATLGNDAITIHYEDLIADPETHLRALNQSLGRSYREDIIEYGNNNPEHRAFGDHVSVHQYTRPVADLRNAWADRFISNGLADFAKRYLDYLGEDLLRQLGYEYCEIGQRLHTP